MIFFPRASSSCEKRRVRKVEKFLTALDTIGSTNKLAETPCFFSNYCIKDNIPHLLFSFVFQFIEFSVTFIEKY